MAWRQILLFILYAGYEVLDELQVYSPLNTPVSTGLIAGLIMDDLETGLIIGGAMRPTVLGVDTFDDASKTDTTTGAVLATALSVSIGRISPQVAISSIMVPAAAIMIQLDVLVRFANTYFAHRIDHSIEENNYKGIERNFLYGTIPWALSRAIPVFIVLAFGRDLVQIIANSLNGNLRWLGTGLTVTGTVLPAVGFVILLRYLPVKEHIAYLIMGFTFTTLFSVLSTSVQALGTGLQAANKLFAATFNGLPMLAVALIGLAFAILYYEGEISGKGDSGRGGTKKTAATTESANVASEGEIADDEL